jgi:hypothetical protein
MAYSFRTREFASLVDPSIGAWKGKPEKKKKGQAGASNSKTGGRGGDDEPKEVGKHQRRPVTTQAAERKQWVLDCLNAEPDGIVTGITARRYISM